MSSNLRPRSPIAQRQPHRKGIALVLVLILIVLISLGAYSFADLMTAQEKAIVMTGRRVQAQAAVASGVEYLKDYLVMLPEDQAALGGHWDNPTYFKNIVVADEPGGVSTRFAIISIMQDQYGEPSGIRWGLSDEGAKVNVNTLATSDLYKSESANAGDRAEDGGGGDEADESTEEDDEGDQPDPQREALMQLPGMIEQIADSILDWIDEDDEPREFGAEADVYSMVGYEPPNAPIQSLDELLLVQGVTSDLLYGADRNHTGVLDENEQATSALLSTGTGSMARGWSAFLTTNSKDILASGEEPIDLNGDDLQVIFDSVVDAGFDEDLANYIVAYRQNGPYTAPPIPEDAPDDFELPEPQSISSVEVDPTKQGGEKFSSLLDLIGTMTQGEFEGEREPVVVLSPYGEDADLATILPSMFANLTVGETGGEGRVNTNSACSSVLSSVPDIDDVVAQGILSGQDPGGLSGDVNYQYPTWPLAQGIVTVEQMKALMPYVSGTGTVFRAQVVGYSDVPGAYARAEVVIDASGDLPQVVSWRDLTHLGLGFEIETLMQ